MESYTLNYNSYIKESLDSQNSNVLFALQEYLDIIKKNTKNAKPIFRGSYVDGLLIHKFNSDEFNNIEVSYLNPKPERKSRDTRNRDYDSLWNIWLSNNKDWIEYPSRKYKTVIGCTDYETVETYGNPSIIIPIDVKNTKFGICKNNDFVQSIEMSGVFDFRIGNYDDFIIMLVKNLNELNDDYTFNHKELFKDYEQVLGVLKHLQKHFLETQKTGFDTRIKVGFWKYAYKYFFDTLSDGYTLYDYTRENLSPEKNDFILSNNMIDFLDVVTNKNLNNNEVWFNGDYLSIKIDSNDYINVSQNTNTYINLIEEIISNLQSIE